MKDLKFSDQKEDEGMGANLEKNDLEAIKPWQHFHEQRQNPW